MIWEITGKGRTWMVFEHPGEAILVSSLVAKKGGMVG
jgi:hypothetical protein